MPAGQPLQLMQTLSKIVVEKEQGFSNRDKVFPKLMLILWH